MPELQDHTHAAHPWPTAQHDALAPDLGAFLASTCFDCTTQDSLGRPLKDFAQLELSGFDLHRV